MKSKKFVLAVLALLAAITMVLLPLAGCKDAAGNGGGVKVSSFPKEVKVLTGYTSPNKTGSEWTYVAFGEWPQSIKAEGVDVDETKSKSKEMGMFTYYLGTDGSWYVKAEEKADGDDYKYSNGEQASRDGSSTKWFKVEPIVWRVLNKDYASTGKALLLAEKILTGGIPYYVNTSTRTITGAGTKEGDPNTVYPNNWQYSTIRAWLNGLDVVKSDDPLENDTTYTGKGFLQTAFTESAQSLIADTSVDNSAASTIPSGITDEDLELAWNSGENQYASKTPTTDKIFLLSEAEATTGAHLKDKDKDITEDYGFDEYSESGTGNTRIRVTTDYAKATGAYQRDSSAGYGGLWWLRSPSYGYVDFARVIDLNGYANNYNFVNLTYGGVVPALSISLGGN